MPGVSPVIGTFTPAFRKSNEELANSAKTSPPPPAAPGGGIKFVPKKENVPNGPVAVIVAVPGTTDIVVLFHSKNALNVSTQGAFWLGPQTLFPVKVTVGTVTSKKLSAFACGTEVRHNNTIAIDVHAHESAFSVIGFGRLSRIEVNPFRNSK